MIPQPPPDSCFEIDRDDKGRTRFTWRPPYSARDRLAALLAEEIRLLVFWFLGATFASILLWRKLLDLFHGPQDVWHHLEVVALGALPPLIAIATGSLLVVSLADLLSRLCPRRWPERITFTTGALLYEPSCFFRWARRPRPLPWGEIGAVRSRRVAGLHLLLLDHGVRRLRIGAHLTNEELFWLVGALRSWVASREPPVRTSNFPPPPKGSWIRMEPGVAGEWRLSWQPRPSFAWGWGWLGSVVVLAVLAADQGGAHVVEFAGQQLQGFRMAVAGPLFAIVFGIVFEALGIGILVFAHAFVEEMMGAIWKTWRRPRRPESLVLTASGLVYDPGHYRLSIIDKPAAVEEMPRWAISDIYLEEKESRRPKLFVLRGAQPLEIGRDLREPEREWLAEVLWLWARSSASTPPHITQPCPEPNSFQPGAKAV